MKHGIHILFFFIALWGLSVKGYASIPSVAVVKDTTQQVIVYFDENESLVDTNYCSNNQSIALLDSLLGKPCGAESVISLKVEAFASPEGTA